MALSITERNGESMKKWGLIVAVTTLSCVVIWFTALGAWESYWDNKCTKAGFLRAKTTLSFDVFCQDGNKSIRIDPFGKAKKAETQPTEVKP